MRSTPISRRRGVVAAAAVVIATAAAAAAAVHHTRARTGRSLKVSAFPKITADEAHVGTVYNFGIQLRNDGSTPIRLLAVSFAKVPAELDVLAPVLGYSCGPFRVPPTYDVGADLTKTRVNIDLTPLSARTLAPSTRFCYYVLLRIKPTKLGDYEASSGTIRYRVGRTTYTEHFDMTAALHVHATGPDPEDIYDPVEIPGAPSSQPSG